MSLTKDNHSIFTEQALGKALVWLRKDCIKRKARDSHLCWDLFRNWKSVKPRLLQQLNNNTYQLKPALSFVTQEDHRINQYTAEDTLVLRVLSQHLQKHLFSLFHCKQVHSVKGQGGVKKAVSRIQDSLGHYKYVIKTDIADYYQSINHHILYQQLDALIGQGLALRLVDQYCHRVEIYQGHYCHVNQGIAKGGSLSPILGNLYLQSIDKLFKQRQVFYARYVDDLVILTKTKGLARKALYKELDSLKLTLSKPKTFIGKIERGFDFLRYAFGGCHDKTTPNIGISQVATKRMIVKLDRLYEQRASSKHVAVYLMHWWRWVHGGLPIFKAKLFKAVKQLINNLNQKYRRYIWLLVNNVETQPYQ